MPVSSLLRGEGSQPREDRQKGGRAQRRNNKTQTLAGQRKRDKAAARVWQGSQDIILTQKQQQRQQQQASACPPDSLTLQLPEPSPLAPWNANDTSKKKTTTYTQLIPSTLPMLAALQVSSCPYTDIYLPVLYSVAHFPPP